MVFPKSPQPTGEQPQPDEQTGEQPAPVRGIVPWYKRPSILQQARTTNDLGLTRPDVVNLRDHKELNGVKYAIVDYEVHEGVIDGKQTEYVILAGFVLDENGQPVKPLAVMTGSSDVLARVMSFRDVIDANTPVIGSFRNQNRAWFFD